jgi:hypothetical protein
MRPATVFQIVNPQSSWDVIVSHFSTDGEDRAMFGQLSGSTDVDDHSRKDVFGRSTGVRSTMSPSQSKLIRTALRRGLLKRCLHCGEGPLFAGWSQLERCSVCGLVFVRNPDDTWAFTIIGDRLPIAAIVLLI